MEMIQQEQRHEHLAMRAPRQRMIALGGAVLFALANVYYAGRSGDSLNPFLNIVAIIPLLAAIHLGIAKAGRRWLRLLLWIPIPIWLIPSLWIASIGHREFRPERMFEHYVISPVPKSVSQIQARRMIGIGELHCYFCFTCDSNAVAAIAKKWQCKVDGQWVYPPATWNADAAEAEDFANRLLGAKAQHLGLPTNYLKEPMLLRNDSTGGKPRIELWVERDQRRAYFFRD